MQAVASSPIASIPTNGSAPITGSAPAMVANRLLVVDDEPEICEFIRDVAEAVGYEVAVSHDHRQFRSLYEEFNPSAIVLDLRMPEGDGVELLRYLADLGCQADVFLASGVDTRTLNTAMRLATAHGLRVREALRKPFMLSDLRAALRRTLNLNLTITEQDLEEAIRANDLFLHYQPKVGLVSNETPSIYAVEALARWEHKVYGAVPPDKFIPIAEASGLIVPLTDLVLRNALEQWRIWHNGGHDIPVAVNLPACLLTDLEFPDRLSDLLTHHDVDPSQLILEVTESGAMMDGPMAMDILTRLRLKGVELSIDDFGTGYSALVQLYRLPFSELKIDKSFVMEMDRSEEAKTIVRSIIDLAYNLDMNVCAEGVETVVIMDLLRSMGCDKAQGFYFSPPVPGKDVHKLLVDAEQVGTATSL